MIAAIFLVALAILVWGVVAGVVGLFIAACIRVGKGPDATPPASSSMDRIFGQVEPELAVQPPVRSNDPRAGLPLRPSR